jgi:hypothetical protein
MEISLPCLYSEFLVLLTGYVCTFIFRGLQEYGDSISIGYQQMKVSIISIHWAYCFAEVENVNFDAYSI